MSADPNTPCIICGNVIGKCCVNLAALADEVRRLREVLALIKTQRKLENGNILGSIYHKCFISHWEDDSCAICAALGRLGEQTR